MLMTLAWEKMSETIIDLVLRRMGLNFSLKPEQKMIINLIVQNKDVMGVLPTGFGKSLTFVMIPLVLDEMYPDKKHTALVISPLKALMKDQVIILNRQSITSLAIMDETNVKDLQGGNFQVIFSSPESIVLPKWRKALKENCGKNICVLVYDEAHCISSWGLDFRPTYRQITILQSLYDVPNLVLTATATRKIQEDIFEVLGFKEENTKVVAVLPDRPSIFLDIQTSSENFEKELEWLLRMIENGNKKVILYVRSINHCCQIYLWLMTSFIDKDIDLTEKLDMFHANTDQDSKDRIMKQFVDKNGNIKVLVTTVAFGMGVNISNIDIVVHWGLPSSVLSYWQEVGRCARDGRGGYAICYAFKRSVNKCSDDEFKKSPHQKACVRKTVLENFLIKGMNEHDIDTLGNEEIYNHSTCTSNCKCKKCQCCIVCLNSCLCPSKVSNALSHFVFG